MYYSHINYSQSRKSLSLHCLLLTRKKMKPKHFVLKCKRNTSGKLSQTAQEGAPANLEKA